MKDSYSKKITRRDAVKLSLMAALGWPLFGRAAQTVPVTTPAETSSVSTVPDLLALVRDPILENALYLSPLLRAPEISPDGAIGVNIRWEKGEVPHWYVEIQRYAGDLIQAGICSNDLSLVDRALPLTRWAFARQEPDGNFPGTGDPFHSTEIFVADTARGLMLLKLSGLPQYADSVKTFTPLLQKAGHWLTRPDIAEMGRTQNAPFTHRNYILAAALGITAELSGDSDLAAAAIVLARRGMGLQWANGVNPEKGGFDVSYQAAGMLMACRYLTSCKDPTVQANLIAMLRKGGKWLCGRVDKDGNLDVTGSTRVAGQETQRSGKVKLPNNMEVLQALCHAAKITGEPSFRETARRFARAHAPISPAEMV